MDGKACKQPVGGSVRASTLLLNLRRPGRGDVGSGGGPPGEDVATESELAAACNGLRLLMVMSPGPLVSNGTGEGHGATSHHDCYSDICKSRSNGDAVEAHSQAAHSRSDWSFSSVHRSQIHTEPEIELPVAASWPRVAESPLALSVGFVGRNCGLAAARWMLGGAFRSFLHFLLQQPRTQVLGDRRTQAAARAPSKESHECPPAHHALAAATFNAPHGQVQGRRSPLPLAANGLLPCKSLARATADASRPAPRWSMAMRTRVPSTVGTPSTKHSSTSLRRDG